MLANNENLNTIKILENLFKYVIDEKLNKHLLTAISKKSPSEITELFTNLQKSGFKGELLNNTDNKTKEKLNEIITYNYYLTPLEGIYINENIAGLIKFLATHEKLIPEKSLRENITDLLRKNMSQDKAKLNFQYQQKMARIWLMSDSNNNKEDIAEFFNLGKDDHVPPMMFYENENSIYYNYDNIKTNYDTIKDSYKSNKIFNFKSPLIKQILEPYINNISDYKVFYLFGNYKGDDQKTLKNLKCAHQYSLLENTADFIQRITQS
jgi:hypothetical protein